MMRRSTRLMSRGYYNSDGLPTVSYKESSFKIFRKRRKPRFANPNVEIIPERDVNLGVDADSDSETIVYPEFDVETNADTIPYTDFDLEIDNIAHTDLGTDSDAETVTYTVLDTDSDAETVTYTVLDTDSDTETIPNIDSAIDSYTEPIRHQGLNMNMNTEARMIAEEVINFENKRMTTGSKMFPKKKYKENISLFFITCLVLFGNRLI
ncbi:hypothetical protein CCH79_00002246, partial [Gambusia affinis]